MLQLLANKLDEINSHILFDNSAFLYFSKQSRKSLRVTYYPPWVHQLW